MCKIKDKEHIKNVKEIIRFNEVTDNIFEWTKNHGYTGDKEGMGVYLESIGMCPIFTDSEKGFSMEPWNG